MEVKRKPISLSLLGFLGKTLFLDIVRHPAALCSGISVWMYVLLADSIMKLIVGNTQYGKLTVPSIDGGFRMLQAHHTPVSTVRLKELLRGENGQAIIIQNTKYKTFFWGWGGWGGKC